MFLYLSVLATVCHILADQPPMVTVRENDTAILNCPRAVGREVRWRRFRNGKEDVFTTKDGQKSHDKRFESLSNTSLIIRNVKESDTGLYRCNHKNSFKQVYLNVTSLPVATTPSPGRILPDTPRDGAPRDDAPRDDAPRDDAPRDDTQRDDAPKYSDHWKIPVGVIIGGALVLSAILTLRFCSKKRAVNKSNVDKTTAEVIYEEIQDCGSHPSRESHLESPRCWIDVAPSTSPPPKDELYSTVNKLKTKGRGNEECVYSLAQDPQTLGNDTYDRCGLESMGHHF